MNKIEQAFYALESLRAEVGENQGEEEFQKIHAALNALKGAAVIAEIYFGIAADAVGEDEVRKEFNFRLDEKIKGLQ